jgi:sulfite exporter TauE/SafE
MELWTGFIVGLAGSLHCIGMCGPIAIALPIKDIPRIKLIIGRVLYNLGRLITYSILGLIFGFIGQSFFIGGYQKTVSIILGILILLTLLLPSKYAAFLTGAGLHGRMTMRMKKWWQYFMGKKSIGALFVIGILNGFLPCGLVYIAIAGSISTGSPLGGALYMALFGLGTFPVMLIMSLVGKVISFKFKVKIRKLLPAGAVLLAALFILRGMSLGIPFVSPKIEQKNSGETGVSGCCHPADSTHTPEPELKKIN